MKELRAKGIKLKKAGGRIMVEKEKPEENGSDWGTFSEINFIKGLGTFSMNGKNFPKKALLEGYLAGSQVRGNWGKIDKATVIEFAEKELLALAEEPETSAQKIVSRGR